MAWRNGTELKIWASVLGWTSLAALDWKNIGSSWSVLESHDPTGYEDLGRSRLAPKEFADPSVVSSSQGRTNSEKKRSRLFGNPGVTFFSSHSRRQVGNEKMSREKGEKEEAEMSCSSPKKKKRLQKESSSRIIQSCSCPARPGL